MAGDLKLKSDKMYSGQLVFLTWRHFYQLITDRQFIREQAGAELGQAQLQLELGFTLIKVCCIILIITNYHYILLSTISL